VFGANSEGALINQLHRRRDWLDAVIVNPTSLAPIAHALAEALVLIGKRALEVQLVEGRTSVLGDAVEARYHGETAYDEALQALASGAEAEQPPAPSRLGKSIGRKAAPTKPAPLTLGSARKTIGKQAPPASKTLGRTEKRDAGPMLSRVTVKAKVSARLAGTLGPEALASWARGEWQALVSGGSVEPGQKDVLEDVLLTLAASAKASDHVILSAMAKLDR
jgi:hypothetical protein